MNTVSVSSKPSADLRAQQSLRQRRMLVGSLSYVFTFSLVVMYWYLGYYGLDVVFNYLGAVIGLTVFFFLAIRTGFNLRFADPSMTFAAVCTAILPGLYVMYHAQQSRGVFLMLCISAGMYGLFQFKMRDFLRMTVLVIASYAGLIALVYVNKPAEINLQVEILQLFALSATFLQFSGLGGYISGLRRKVKENNKELATRNGELEQALQRIEELAMRDELTGVFNRRFLMETIRKEKLRSERTGSVFSLCILDADHFKRINDQYGHLAGDQVLQAIARTASAALRETDYFGRYGGEEFALVLTGTAAEGALILAERVRLAIAGLNFDHVDPGLAVTVSIGIADSRVGEDTANTFKRADDALYRAKEAGRNRSSIAPAAPAQ